MAGVLFVLFVVIPIIELFVLVQVASWIGTLPAIALVLLLSFAGVWIAKREGVSVARRVQGQLQQGEVPTAELVNGLLDLFGSAVDLGRHGCRGIGRCRAPQCRRRASTGS